MTEAELRRIQAEGGPIWVLTRELARVTRALDDLIEELRKLNAEQNQGASPPDGRSGP